VKEPTIDAERLAALLDGRLDDRARAELLARLAESEEDFEAFVDAAAVQRELEERGGTPTPAVPLRERWFLRRGRWLAVAAAVVGVALVPLVWIRFRTPGVDDPGRFVAALEAENAGLPAAWDGRPWSTTRSTDDAVTPAGLAARVGARIVDLELAVRAGDSSAAMVAAEIATLLSNVPAGGPAVHIYDELADSVNGASSQQVAGLLTRGRLAIAAALDVQIVDLAAWTETARLAGVRRDTGFFSTRFSRAVLARGVRAPPSSASAMRAFMRVRAAVPANGSVEWDTLERALTELLRELAMS
jgi:hypothetical protein